MLEKNVPTEASERAAVCSVLFPEVM